MPNVALTLQDGTAARPVGVSSFGDPIVGNGAQGKGGESFDAPTDVCRPPGRL